jgi:hypothetical protein
MALKAYSALGAYVTTNNNSAISAQEMAAQT